MGASVSYGHISSLKTKKYPVKLLLSFQSHIFFVLIIILFLIFLLSGNKYLAVITDYLTKWVEVEAIPDKSSETIAAVFTKFVTNHGCPEVLITDQGREFCNDLNDKVCQQFGIEHRVASAYHPQTGGHTERFNRTLCDMLVHCVNSSHNDWDVKLPFVLFAYRTSKHATTKQTPFYLVYGRQARLPVELDVSASQSGDDQDSEVLLKERIDSFIDLLNNREKACSDIKVAQSKQKKHYDASIPETEEVGFKVGDHVLVHNTRKTTRKGGKLEVKWKGPYQITKVSRKGTYLVEGLKTSVSGSRLKSYKTDNHDQKYRDTNMNTDKSASARRKIEPDIKRKKETENTDNDDHKRSTKRQNQPDHHLPMKKRKISVQSLPAEMSSNSETEPSMQYKPVNKEWQEQISTVFKSKVKNTYTAGHDRFISRNAKPTRKVNMRGDGNCLFRSFSYLVFGVQTYHDLIRQSIVEFMKENENLMRGVMQDSVPSYLDKSMMANSDTWGTEVEIFAFATLTGTIVYVYSLVGSHYRWLEYKPLTNTNRNDRAVFIQNVDNHFVPVLDVDGEEYSKQPYLRIKDHIPEKYHSILSSDLLDAALVNSFADEELLRKRDKSVTSVYVKVYTDTKYDVEELQGMSQEVDANIFNLVCDWGDTENK